MKNLSLTELLGIELPIIQAPMAGAQSSAMAIAVALAGGLGSLPCAMLSPDQIRSELAKIRAATDKPINVNFFCHEEPVTNAELDNRWREKLSRYYDELGLDRSAPPAPAQQRRPFGVEAADAVAEFTPEVISFHFGLPTPELLDRVREWRPKIVSSATTLDEALWLEERGVDMIVAQGWEAGGHRGSFLSEDLTRQPGTFALVPQIVAAVNVPVIAAGGVANAKGVAAAMQLGAAGVQVGTAYLLCPESTITSLHRAALKSDRARHTAVTNVFTGRPARGIMNRIMRELGPIDREAPAFPLAYNDIAPLRAKAESIGTSDFSPLWAGQNATGCQEISAEGLTRELAGLL
jgi:nitronate monooxygenase